MGWIADFACLPVGRECGIEDKITIFGFVELEVHSASAFHIPNYESLILRPRVTLRKLLKEWRHRGYT
jgi:hypothetical protein